MSDVETETQSFPLARYILVALNRPERTVSEVIVMCKVSARLRHGYNGRWPSVSQVRDRLKVLEELGLVAVDRTEEPERLTRRSCTVTLDEDLEKAFALLE